MIESGLLTHLVTLGYGLHIWDFPLENMQAMMLPTTVAGTFSVTSAVWSKTSFGITLLLITDGWIKKLTWFCIISMNLAMFFSAFLPWVTCTPIRKTWDLSVQGGSCWDGRVIVYYDIFSAAYSALMDFTLAFLPWQFLWKLQMKRSEKIGVGIALSMGVLAGATAIIKTSKLPRMLSTDFGKASLDVILSGGRLWLTDIKQPTASPSGSGATPRLARQSSPPAFPCSACSSATPSLPASIRAAIRTRNRA